MSNFSCSSASSNSVTEDYWQLKNVDLTRGKTFGSLLLIFELFGFPWNLLVLITIIKEKLYHQPTIIFLLNLLAADIFVLLYPSPLLMTVGFSGEFIIGSSDRVRCKMCYLMFSLTTPFFNSYFTVALMSLDRFLYIYKPFKYERASSKYIALVAVMIAAVLSVALGIASRLIPGEVVFQPSVYSCLLVLDKLSSWFRITIAVIGTLTLAVIIISNGWFSYIVLRNIKIVYSYKEHQNENGNQSKWAKLKKRAKTPRYRKQRRLYSMFCLLQLSSIAIWIPFIWILGASVSYESFYISSVMGSAILILQYSQVILHPILETLLIPDIRRPLTKMITCRCFKRNDSKLTCVEEQYNRCKASSSEKDQNCFLFTAIQAALLPRNRFIVSSSNRDSIQKEIETNT